jgi:hypothetical protein
VLDTVVYRNVLPSDGTASDVLDSHNQPIVFNELDHVNARDISAPDETHTDWERFLSLEYDLISPRIHNEATEETKKLSASVYRLSISKLTLSEINHELPA